MEFFDERDNNPVQEKNSDIIKAFTRMFFGLLVTAVTAYFTYTSGAFLTISYPLLAIVEVVVVLVFSLAFSKLSPGVVTALYYAYAILNGVTLSTIFAVFEITEITSSFFISAVLFGALALYGYTTNRDITKYGSIFMVGLIVGIIASVINIFIGNSLLSVGIDWFMLLLFCGLTAYDMKKLTTIAYAVNEDKEKLYVYFAMQLYLDFINLFIRILSLTARRSRD